MIVPASETDGNVDVEVFCKTREKKQNSQVFLGSENKKYESQVMKLLIEFKKDFCIRMLLKKIKKNQEKAIKISKELKAKNTANSRSPLLDDLVKTSEIINMLREEIKVVAMQ